jgi:hypothetical protein
LIVIFKMKNALKSLTVISLITLVSGCSTMMNDAYQKIPITSNPSRAAAIADSKISALTPTILRLERGKDHVIEISKEGYKTAKFILKHTMSGAMWGNVICGGAIGAMIDGCVGSGFKLTPEQINANLEKTGN